MGQLILMQQNAHSVDVNGHHMLMHVPTSSLFEMDQVSYSVLNQFKSHGRQSVEKVQKAFETVFPAEDILESIDGFKKLDILRDPEEENTEASIQKVEDIPLSTIILNVNTGCNLSCTYCYKEDLTTPSKGEVMSLETAKSSFDMLLQQAHDRERVNVVFFGGEPLSNFALIQQVVAYAVPCAKEKGKKVDFSLTTNGTLLTEEIVHWLDAHAFGLTISMDGPKDLHDKNRKTVGGKGTYDVVARKVRMLLQNYRSRPVGARVTLSHDVIDVIRIHEHLKNDFGFHEVGFGPATSGPLDAFNLGDGALQHVFEDMKALGTLYVEAALRGENIGFSNMHQLITDIAVGRKKAVPCGAGLGLLAVDKKGDLHLCHRFIGSDEPTYGNVESGINVSALSTFIEKAQDRSSFGCQTCHARSICAGGCYHESYARTGSLHDPVYHYCDLIRDWVDFGIKAYMRILQENPSFIEVYVEPRERSGIGARSGESP